MLLSLNITILYNMEIRIKDKSLTLFPINACHLNKTFDDLQHLLS